MNEEARKVAESDDQRLFDYGQGIGGPEVIDAYRAKHSVEADCEAKIEMAVEARKELEALARAGDPGEALLAKAGFSEGMEKEAPSPKPEGPENPKGFFKGPVGRQGDANRREAWPEAPRPPVGAEGFEALTYPRGLLGHVTQHIQDTTEYPSRVISLAAALSVLGKIIDGRVLGPRNCKTSLYIWLVAETGAGKQHGLNCISFLLRTVGLQALVVASGIASVQAIEEIVLGTESLGTERFEAIPNALIEIDEIGSWLARITSGQGGNVSEIPGVLCTLWGWTPDVPWFGTKSKGKEMRAAYDVALSIFGASTQTSLIAALKAKHVSTGFISRNLYFNAGTGADVPVDPKYDWQSIPAWLEKALKFTFGKLPRMPKPNEPMKLVLANGSVARDYYRLEWGKGAKELHREFVIKVRAMPVGMEREVWIRAPEMALRIATIVAVFRGSITVEVEDLKWSMDLVKGSTRTFHSDLEEHMSEDVGIGDLARLLRKEWMVRKIMSQGEVHRFAERKSGERDFSKIDKAINHLEICGDIFSFGTPPTPGKPTVWWRWHTVKGEDALAVWRAKRP
jgi:hypothetical protein